MCLHILAQSAQQLFVETLPWLIGLGVIVFFGAMMVYFIRRMIQSDSSGIEDGFTLHELRQLHSQGELSDNEYERAKHALIGHLQESIESDDENGPS